MLVSDQTIEWTKSQIARLGKNLVASDPPQDVHLRHLQRLLELYDEALEKATDRIQKDLDIRATSRLKTTGTLIEKLKRSGGRSLPNIQDVAGARIVVDGTLSDQTKLAEALQFLFSDGAKAPSVKDRRIDPMHGYRAVHLVVFVDDRPIEIQIRTKPQDRWANAYEKLADVVGRGIRYGEQPDGWTILMVDPVVKTAPKSVRESLARGGTGPSLGSDSSDDAEFVRNRIMSDNFVSNTLAAFRFAANASYVLEEVENRRGDDWGPDSLARLEEAQEGLQATRQGLEQTIDRILEIRNTVRSVYLQLRDEVLHGLGHDELALARKHPEVVDRVILRLVGERLRDDDQAPESTARD